VYPLLALLILVVFATLTPVRAIAQATDSEMLTNNSVIEMVSVQLPEEVIITKIQTSPAKFDLSISALGELNRKGVPPAVVKAMMAPRPQGVAAAANANPDDPNAVHEFGIYLYSTKSSGKKMTLLEPTVYTQSKSGGMLASAMTYGIAKMKWKAVVRGGKANVRTSDASGVFYFYFEETRASLSHSNAGTSTPNEYTLLRFDVKGEARETTVMTGNAWGTSSGTDDKANVPFTFEKLRPGVYKVVPNAPLEPGEYGFIGASSGGAFGAGAVSANRVFDFGINPAE